MRRWFCVLLLLFLATVPALAQTAPPDWARVGEETAQQLAALIRIDTSNPPGNELAAARHLETVLRQAGIEAEVIETKPGRAAVVARLRGDGSQKPLLLLGHLDVVGVEREKWSVEPFGGVIRDGYVWGRGAIDDKGGVIANLMVTLLLQRQGVKLARDVIFAAVPDEESGGNDGIDVLLRDHFAKVSAEFAINEGGRVFQRDGRVRYVGVQTSEKSPYNLTVLAEGVSGHASVPRADNPIVHLVRALERIASYEPPVQLTPTTVRFFSGLAKIEEGPARQWMEQISDPGRQQEAARRLAQINRFWNSILRNTISPTLLRAGIRSNVIPATAQATLNVRLLPGEKIETVVKELEARLNDPAVHIKVREGRRPEAPAMPFDTELFRALARAAANVFPQAVVLPSLSSGATDSSQLRSKGIIAYGLVPYPVTEEDLMRVHGNDERVPIESLGKGVEFLYRAVVELAGTPQAGASGE